MSVVGWLDRDWRDPVDDWRVRDRLLALAARMHRLTACALLVAFGCKDEEAAARPSVEPVAAVAKPAEPAPAVPAAPPAPVATAKPSSFPKCMEIEVSNAKPDEMSALQALGEALVTNDGAKLGALFAGNVKIGKKKIKREAAIARATADGAQALVGFEPHVFHDTKTRTNKCAWSIETLSGENAFEAFTGGGYGETNIVRFSKIDGAWKIVALEIEDYGSP